MTKLTSLCLILKNVTHLLFIPLDICGYSLSSSLSNIWVFCLMKPFVLFNTLLLTILCKAAISYSLFHISYSMLSSKGYFSFNNKSFFSRNDLNVFRIALLNLFIVYLIHSLLLKSSTGWKLSNVLNLSYAVLNTNVYMIIVFPIYFHVITCIFFDLFLFSQIKRCSFGTLPFLSLKMFLSDIHFRSTRYTRMYSHSRTLQDFIFSSDY